MEREIQKIGKKIQEGALVIYPTDTVYGIGASIASEKALCRIYEVKRRNFSSPLIALLDSVDRIEKIAFLGEKREWIQRLSSAFWPGGLTIILQAKETVPKVMIANGDTVGVRIPNHGTALEIIHAAGGILATTSANISGEPTPKSFEEISSELKEKVEIVIDGGICPIGEASTILDFTKEKIEILRLGAISKEEIETILGKII